MQRDQEGMVKKFLLVALLLCGHLMAGVAGSASAAEGDDPLVFGVLNQQSPVRTAQRWNPLLKYLSENVGREFRLRMGPAVKDTNAMMERGEFDFAFTNHNFRKEYDGVYRVVAKLSGRPIFGVIAVPEDSPARALRDLDGKRIAFPSREAFVAYAVPALALQSRKVKFEAVLAGNQEGALAQLKARQVDAAAVNSRFLTQYAAQNGLRYREIFTSEGYADLPVIVHPRIPKALADKVRTVLAGMKDDPKGAAILEAAGFSGFEPATDAEYDNVRRVYRSVD